MIRYIRFILFSLCFVSAVLAARNTNAQVTMMRANPRTVGTLYEEKNYDDALIGYLRLSEEDPENELYMYRVGMCYFHMEEYDQAADYLKKSIRNWKSIANDAPPDALYYAARACHLIHDYEGAIDSYSRYRTLVEYDLEFEIESLKKFYGDKGTTEVASQMKLIHEEEVIKELDEILYLLDDEINRCNYGKVMVDVPVGVVVENMGAQINTKYSEYAPIMSGDGVEMAYTSRTPQTTGGNVAPDGDYYEDIFLVYPKKRGMSKSDLYNQKNSVGHYSISKNVETSKPRNIGLKINTKGHEGAVQYSVGGDKLFIYRDFNLWVSKWRNEEWGNAVQLKGFKEVFVEGAFEPSLTISSDENVLFFSSNREGGYGGLDLYVTTKKKNGTWNKPRNMGPAVNTRHDEDAPYFDLNSKTLYFSSKGHSSIGGYDVFKTELHERKWRPPVNMGYLVNSAGDDVFFMMTPKSNRAYYSSDKMGGYGRMDIYRLTFAGERPLYAEVKGLVLLGEDEDPTFSKISILDQTTGKELSVHYSDSITGEYLLLLPHGITYDIMVEVPGFAPYREEYEIPSQISQDQFYQEIKHIHITDADGNIIGQKVVLENAYYDSNKHGEDDITICDQIRDAISYSDSLEIISNEKKNPYTEFVRSLIHPDNKIELPSKSEIKFYISQDSLVTLLKEDDAIKPQVKEIMLAPQLLEDEMEAPYHKYIMGMIAEDHTTMEHIELLSEEIGVPVESLVAEMQREQMLDANSLKKFNVQFFSDSDGDEELTNLEAYEEPDILVLKLETIEEVVEEITVEDEDELMGTAMSAKLANQDDVAKRVNKTIIESKSIKEDIARVINKHKDADEKFINLPSVRDKTKKKEDGSIGSGDLLTTFYFDFDHGFMKAINCVLIEELYKSIKDKSNIKLKIIGHTDSEGEENYNIKLSEQRARWVSKYLNSLGFEWIRMSVEWKGEKQLASKDRDSNGNLLISEMHKNRRVEIKAIVR